jgi:predicted HTH domain antitoxin
MKTISVNIPEEMSEMEMKIFLAGNLYEKKKLTLGQAAEVAGLTKRTFIEIMGKYGFSIFGDSTEDLMADIQNA